MFSSRNLKASGLLFKYLTHFGLIFVGGVRKVSHFSFQPVVGQFSQHHVLKKNKSVLVSLVKYQLIEYISVYF